jgi:hypothetical protein
MPTDELDQIRVQLNAIEELFAQPEIDPFDPNTRYVSGVDEAVQKLTGRSPKQKTLQLEISLPAQHVKPGLQDATKDALARYANAQIKGADEELEYLRRRGRFSLLSAIIIVVVAIVVVWFIGRLNLLGDTIQSFLVGGLSVFSWVAVWEPFNIYLYDWRAPARTRYIFEQLRKAQVVILPS